MNRRTHAVGAVGLLACAAVAIGLSAPAVAADGQTEFDDLEPHAQQAIAQMADDASIDTVQLIQDAGINELNPLFAGTVVVDSGTEGVVKVHYLESSPHAEELLEILAELEGTTPLPVEAVPSQVDVGHLDELALHLVDGAYAAEFGVYDVTGVHFDELSGEATITTTDPASVERHTNGAGESALTIEGVRFDLVLVPDGATDIVFQTSWDGTELRSPLPLPLDSGVPSD